MKFKRHMSIILSFVLLVSCFTIVGVATSAKTISMHRLYNPNSGEHFYTKDTAEKNHLVGVGWKYEGIGWNAPGTSKTPVYRLYNPNAGEHHYTMKKSERDMLIKAGWNYEGIGWYSDDAKSVPLYRQYNPNAYACNHNYTKSKSENDWLVSLGWRYEGIGWYGKSDVLNTGNTNSGNSSNGNTGTSENILAQAEKYSYTVEQILQPFGEYFIVSTNFPKIENIRFSVSKGNEKFILEPVFKTFADVKYHNKKTREVVKNKYIFVLKSEGSGDFNFNGGSMSLEATNEKYTPPTVEDYGAYTITYSHERKFLKSSKKYITLPKFENALDYLVRKYADPVKGTPNVKLQAVEDALLNNIAVYPHALLDRSKIKNNFKFPALASSPYSELGLNKHLEIYKSSDDSLLCEYVYPFVLDSLGFPGTLAAVAKKLDPGCTVKSGGIHYLVEVKFSNGESRYFGGAGKGRPGGIYLDLIKKDYDFSKGKPNILQTMNNYLTYADKSYAESQALAYKLSDEKIIADMPLGGWGRVGFEGSTEKYYAYFFTGDNEVGFLNASSCWADGRYINIHEVWEKGAKFSDHPTADIIFKNHLYRYEDSDKKWHRINSEETLTLEQVKNLKPDRNTNITPKHGCIYDGTAEPGTKF